MTPNYENYEIYETVFIYSHFFQRNEIITSSKPFCIDKDLNDFQVCATKKKK